MPPLSDDVLYNIFMYLPTLQCVASADLVSKSWHAVTMANSEKLWQHLATTAKKTNAVRGGVLDLCGVSWKARHLMQRALRAPRTADDLNTAFEFYLEAGCETFANAEKGLCDLMGKYSDHEDDEDEQLAAAMPARRISVRVRVANDEDVLASGRASFESDEDFTFGFEPHVYAVYAQRRSDGAVACLFHECHIYSIEEDMDERYEIDGKLYHTLSDGKTICNGASGSDDTTGNCSILSGSAVFLNRRPGMLDSHSADWKVPFTKGDFKMNFCWQHYQGGTESSFNVITPSNIWDALNPRSDWVHGPFFK